VIVACPTCGKRYKVADKAAGRKVRCTSCQGVFLAEAQTGPAAQEAPPPPPNQIPAAGGPSPDWFDEAMSDSGPPPARGAAVPTAPTGTNPIETEETRLGSFLKPAYALVLTANGDLDRYPIHVQIAWMRQALVGWLAKRGPKAAVLDFWWMDSDATVARRFVQAAQQLICEDFPNAQLVAQMSIEVKYMDPEREELVEQELQRVA
jgi:predicted Zn finger-like uncharacterized protein